MIETKVRKVGNSAVMTLTSEMLAILDVKEGDSPLCGPERRRRP